MLSYTETGVRRSQIFLRMREFIGSREAIPPLPERRGLRPFTEKGREVPTNVRKRFGILLPRALLPWSLTSSSWPAYRSLAPFIRFRTGAPRDSHSQSLHLRSARLGANTEDKVRCSCAQPRHTAGTRPDHASFAGSKSGKPLSIIGKINRRSG